LALFTAKVDYALRALLDLAGQPPGRSAQSREIAARQGIPESYLNQLLVTMRRGGLVRSIRGAAGGYVIGRSPHQLTLAEILETLQGPDFLGGMTDGSPELPAAWVIRNLHGRLSDLLQQELKTTTLADLAHEVHRLDEARSVMLGL
jgi:Rrf2 family protein